MEVNPHNVFYCFKLDFEKLYGCFNTSDLKNPNSLDFNIAAQLFQLFKTLCNQFLEVAVDESLEINTSNPEYLEIEDLSKEDKLDISLSQEFNSQVSLTESSESPSASEFTTKKRKTENKDQSEAPSKKRKIEADFLLEVETPCDSQSFSFETMQKIIAMKDVKKLKFSSIKRLYPRLQPMHICRFRQYVENNGNFSFKMYEIEQYVRSRFIEARQKFLPVHDIDLRRWAIEEARRIGLGKFKASHNFINNLKLRLRITSRKVTKLVTKKHLNEKTEIEKCKSAHLQLTNSKISQYNLNFVMNSDQSGFSKEYFSTRTLSVRGEKDTLQLVKSVSNTTHTYTIQPTITASGKLLSPMLICLQETTGNDFGPRVHMEVLQNTPSNLVVVCSKSGKLTKEHVKKWISECLILHIKGNTLLLIDSWTGQSSEFLIECLPPNKKDYVEAVTIPAGTTGLCQPLDVYFFRQYKIFVRTIYNQMMLELTEEQSHDRLFFIKMHSLVHNQLTAPVFRPMLQYAWYKSGYAVADPGKFKNVNEVCFNKAEILSDCAECENSAFIKCAHCNKLLCFSHFLEKSCWH